MTDKIIAALEEALGSIDDPNTGETLSAGRAIKGVEMNGTQAEVKLVVGYPVEGFKQAMAELVKTAASTVDGVESVEVEVGCKVAAHKVQNDLTPLAEVKNIIAIASGKGGVGKSTTAINLALALHADGATVGVLDADIYGPSQPRMVGLSGRPESHDGERLEPMVNHNIQTMSIGYLIEEDTPMIWRGPMVTQALQQLLKDTNWKGLDYLIIDLPPGTGDIQLTLAQQVPVSGAIIVTTPQDIALMDARKGLKMFEKVDVPVLGVVENMSTHICTKCGHEEPIFGEGGGKKMADDYDIDLLGSLPLDIRIREQTDSGKPTVLAEPDGHIAQLYREIGRKVAGRLSVQARNLNVAFPSIVIDNS